MRKVASVTLVGEQARLLASGRRLRARERSRLRINHVTATKRMQSSFCAVNVAA